MSVDGGAVGSPLRADDPRQLGAYKILGRLGEGGMGCVYLAETADGQRVAVKVIRADLAEEPEFRRRFRGEVARAQEVPPFCTAEVLDADPDHDTPYLVVEFVDGPSLADVVADRGPLTPANLYGVAIGVATALVAIHGAGVIHRDLKPSNVLLAPGTPKVIDFGIARAVEAVDGDTRTDQLIGTVAYMAPERLDPTRDQRKLTPAADIFAWGAVVAYAATGRVPFLAETPPSTAVAILTQPPDLSGIPEPLRALVERALAKNPKQRPSARKLLDELLTTAPRRAIPAARAAEVAATSARAAEVAAAEVPSADLPADGEDPERLTSGLRMAYVDVTGEVDQPTATDPTRVESPDLPAALPRAGAGRRRWRRVGIGALVVSVLASVGTLAGILGGVIVLPGHPTAAQSPLPSTSVSTPPSLPVSPSPTGPPDFVNVRVSDPMSGPYYWLEKTSPQFNVECGFDKGKSMFVSMSKISGSSSFRCAGSAEHFSDFTMSVDVRIDKPDSCAAIWFRFVQGGYALRICSGRMQLGTHSNGGFDTLLDKPIPALKVGSWTRIGVTAYGSTITVSQCKARSPNPCAPTDVIVGANVTNGKYTTGIVTVGIFEPPTAVANQPYQVSYANFVVAIP